MREGFKILPDGRHGLLQVAFPLLLQFHHLREHASDSSERAAGTVHDEGNALTWLDDPI